MIKERELLERAMSMIDYRYAPNEAIALTREISGLLAQPEHIPDVGNMVTQEPVYWENEKKALLNEIDHLTNRLAQPEQAPVAWRYKTHNRYTYTEENYHELEGEGEPLYASPQKREALSEDEMRAIWKEGIRGEILFVEIVRAIEKAHGITGGGE